MNIMNNCRESSKEKLRIKKFLRNKRSFILVSILCMGIGFAFLSSDLTITGPLLSNIMLNELDKELETRGLNFVRYADDCLIMVKSEKAANRVMESITTFITKKLGLKVNVEKSKVARPDNIKYLGFGFYKKINQNVWRTKPHIKSVQKFKTKLRDILVRSRSISLDERLLKLKQLIYGWVNYFKIADIILTPIDQNIRRKLRVIIWKQ